MSLVLGVIPARFASTRFPGKALATLGNRTMIEQVWRRASEAERIDRLIVATDDQRILDAVQSFGGEARRTSRNHESGTDRVAQVVRELELDYEVVINIQGDEPLLTASSLDRLVGCFDADDAPAVATLSEPIESTDELFDPNTVKVVTDGRGRALYFSRSPIPYHRGAATNLQIDFRDSLGSRTEGLRGYRKHQGIYAYTRAALLDVTRLDPSDLERDEGLEQLRLLQAGYAIQVVKSDFRSQSVDTPEDLKRVAQSLTEAG